MNVTLALVTLWLNLWPGTLGVQPRQIHQQLMLGFSEEISLIQPLEEIRIQRNALDRSV